MPSVRITSAPSTVRTPRARYAQVPSARKPGAAAVIAAAAAMVLAGCEYTYDDGRDLQGPVASEATRLPGPVFTRDPLQNDPVSEPEVGAWVERTLPDTGLPVAHAGSGFMGAGSLRTESTPVLGTGTYALALACRSQRRVTFTVRSDSLTLVDLGLRCGIIRENIIYLSSETALSIRVEARTSANYAYRLRLL